METTAQHLVASTPPFRSTLNPATVRTAFTCTSAPLSSLELEQNDSTIADADVEEKSPIGGDAVGTLHQF